jgi:hypothetical protein
MFAEPTAGHKDFFGRLIEAMTLAQARKAEAEIPVHLQALDDTSLRAFGYSEKQVLDARTRGLL